FVLPDPAGAPNDPLRLVRQRSEVVRELVTLLNADVAFSIDPAGAELKERVLAMVPNYLSAAAQEWDTVPSPGCRSEPVLPQHLPPPGAGQWRYRFDNICLQDLVLRARGDRASETEVVVAVLDTCPSPQRVTKFPGGGGQPPRDNLLYQSLLGAAGSGQVVLDATAAGAPALPQDYLRNVMVNHNGEPAAADPADPAHNALVDVADHGLFATGIVHDVAPRAQIRLIRVLNDYGAGDSQVLLATLAALLGDEKLRPTAARRLIVNLSLAVDLPPGTDLLRFWYPAAYQSLKGRLARGLAQQTNPAPDIASVLAGFPAPGPQLLRMLELLHLDLQETIATLRDQGVLVVAAAGNENRPPAPAGQPLPPPGQPVSLPAPLPPPEPCWPARFDQVLGVAAVQGNQSAATYSNRGDVVTLENGLGVYGGEARPPAPGQPPRIPIPGRALEADAVRGLYSAPALAAGKNETGWALWAGTSFAAPVITGLAADLWAEHPELTPRQVIEWLRHHAALLGPANDPDGPLDAATILARQEWVPAPGVRRPRAILRRR
ncbi:MAG TPA: S8 family serine peptidase, partial [Chloroflexota bacterium]|nr:S8 family serine peptidase [Chloroflexota bacterium]